MLGLEDSAPPAELRWAVFDDIISVAISVLEGIGTFANVFPHLKLINDATLYFFKLAQVGILHVNSIILIKVFYRKHVQIILQSRRWPRQYGSFSCWSSKTIGLGTPRSDWHCLNFKSVFLFVKVSG